MKIIDSYLVFETHGHACFSERGEQQENGGWTSIDLLDEDTDNLNFSVSIEDENDGKLIIKMTAYHLEESTSNKVFHPGIEAHLNLKSAKALHTWLEFILTNDLLLP